MGIAGFSAAEAGPITPADVNGLQHFFDCFGVMIHDGTEHAQFCAPSGSVPSNSSLGSFSGGASSACPTFGDAVGPRRPSYDVASLGEIWEAPSGEPALANMQIAVGDCACYPCVSGGADLGGSPFQPFLVASLDDIDWSAAKAAVHATLLACCPKGAP
jgi:hypothetical protein